MKRFNLFLIMAILLCFIGCGNPEKLNTESTISEDIIAAESFFFSPGIEAQRVNIVSTIPDLPNKMDLLIIHIKSYPKGDLYELRLDYENEFSSRDYDGWDRRNLGYFYVEENLIYRVKENEADGICTWSEEELKNTGTIVCQESPLEDKLGEEARGFHETIDIDGNFCIYKSYYNNVETDFYEGFIWEKGKGLVNYYSGYGAQSFYLEINPDDKELSEAILYDAENKTFPIMSEEELAEIEWDNDLIPYVEYNFLDENEFWTFSTMNSNIFISFSDLDLDGQREMMITIPAYRDGSKTFIYTVENGEVIYCGWTIAGTEYAENSTKFEFCPQNLFDIYVNDKGEIRYFSSDSDEHGTFGNYSIYESGFENNHILCQPVFAMIHSGDNYGYWTKDTWDDWGNYELDDEDYTALNNIITKYMSGYKKVNVPFFYSEYAIPGYARDLEAESQEAISNNILAGIAQAVKIRN